LDADLPPNCIHQNHVFRVRVDNNLLLPVYFATYLLTTHARTYFLQASKRTTNLASINLSQLKALSVPIPPLELQEEFAEMVTVFRSVEQTQSTSSNKLDDLFVSLLSRAFSGDLTSIWREKHKEELQRAAVERDKKLGVRGEVATLKDAKEGRLTPEEEEQLRKVLGNFAININQMNQDFVESVARMSKDIIEPILQSIRQSLQAFDSIQLPKIPEISSESVIRYIDNLPVPQENA
jgi:hypothetical protein